MLTGERIFQTLVANKARKIRGFRLGCFQNSFLLKIQFTSRCNTGIDAADTVRRQFYECARRHVSFLDADCQRKFRKSNSQRNFSDSFAGNTTLLLF